MTYYKFLEKGGIGPYSAYQWSLPRNGKPGKWLPEIKNKLTECSVGYHFCTETQLIEWMRAECYEIEVSGKILRCSDKMVTSKCRLIRKIEHWSTKTIISIVSDLATNLLPDFESKYPKDDRPRKAILVARDTATTTTTTTTDAAYVAYVAAYAAATDTANAYAANADYADTADAAANAAAYVAAYAAADAAYVAAYADYADAAYLSFRRYFYLPSFTRRKEETRWRNERILKYIKNPNQELLELQEKK